MDFSLQDTRQNETFLWPIHLYRPCSTNSPGCPKFKSTEYKQIIAAAHFPTQNLSNFLHNHEYLHAAAHFSIQNEAIFHTIMIIYTLPRTFRTHRCAIISTVCCEFSSSRLRATRTRYSEVASSADVASSRMRMRGFWKYRCS